MPDVKFIRFTRISPSMVTMADTIRFKSHTTVKNVAVIRYHPLTARFVGQPKLEQLYMEKAAKEWSPRSFRIVCVFLLLYFMTISPNLYNLISPDDVVRDKSKTYFLYVFPAMIPIPIMLWVSTLKRFKSHFHNIYAVVVTCWTFSIIGGGMYSMLHEWKLYVQDDVTKLLNYTHFLNATDVFTISHDDEAWPYPSYTGTGRDILFDYMGDVLLPAATMNINLLRMVLVSIFIPLLRIGSMQSAVVSVVTTLAYTILTVLVYPTTSNKYFNTNKILVFCFPLLFSIIMLLQNRDMERMLRVEFLQMHEKEQEAEIAKKQREVFAEENKNLKQELKKQQDYLENPIDLESPVHKIISDLRALQDESNFTDAQAFRMAAIVSALSRLDTNLFTPDISTQMANSDSEVDKDTKNWAISVLGKKEYNPTSRLSNAANVMASATNAGSVGGTGSNHIDVRSKSRDHIYGEAVVALEHMPHLDTAMLATVVSTVQKEGWNTDVFTLDTNGRPLFVLATALFEHYNFYDDVKVDRIAMKNFMYCIDNGYVGNPYHNVFHAADVMNSVNYLIAQLQNGYIRSLLTVNEFFAALVAAAIHDYKHPGKSNNFMIKARHRLAMQYHDKSVLENMHLAESFLLTQDNPNCDIWARMKDKSYREMRKAIIEMVLATDLSMHLQLVGSLKSMIISDEKHDIANDPMVLMRVVVKCGDIGHSAKSVKLHGLWSSLIVEEFFLQGDAERDSATEVSPFMDRWAENSAKNQIGFFEFIVLPFFDTVSQVVFQDSFRPIHMSTKRNYALWKEAASRNMTSIAAIREDLFSDDNAPAETL
ncbi:hypothetical protein H310_04473 [Aphanomyces invadans]|uniref:Phosphodiesterase n=1 Tax=Aphanomyces invadans TaxID=157072 RepID=A0A024UEQ5_9STRA|nr:hypothetical protein H310_04473 [Aphanomyces invadans]ETW04113.1 hypothetical protein H310_04473 [Aphanomyces invadans]|eukprot:XP_008867069.1 hypothetical protein H310_04473 [Aphanomyces invadans]